MREAWYYVQGSEPFGPHSQRELRELFRTGTIQRETLLWREGMNDWTPATEHEWLTTAPPAGLPPIPPPKAPPRGLPPKPPAQSIPPRPMSRPAAPPSQNHLLAAAAGVILLVGVGVGWLAHAILMPTRVKDGVVAQAAPTKVILKSAKQAAPVATAQVATAVSPTTVPAKPPSETPAATAAAAPTSTPEVNPPAAESPVAVTTPPAVPSPASPSPSPATSSPPTPSKPNSQSSTPITQTLYQEIDVQRAPKFAILGVVTAQSLRYQILSELRVGQPDAEGIRTVAQTVVNTRLVAADALSQPTIEPALAKIKGWQFSYTLSKEGEVLKMMAGPADAPVAAKVEPMGGKGFLVTSVMDEAGWKELAQLSFYAPDEQASGNKRELRQMTHDFGPLGSWAGETSFQRKGTQQGLLRIDYAHRLTYRPPAKDAVGELPFAVKGAELRPDIAGGSIWYDVKAKRVRQAEDHFRVKGEIATDLAAVELEEEQAIAVRITDENPWKK